MLSPPWISGVLRRSPKLALQCIHSTTAVFDCPGSSRVRAGETRDPGTLTPFVVQHLSRISLNNRAVKERRIHAAVQTDGVVAGEATEIVF